MVLFIAWTVLLKEDDGVSSDNIAPAIIGALDQVYLGCTVFWFNQGSHLLCDQKIADKLHTSKEGGGNNSNRNQWHAKRIFRDW